MKTVSERTLDRLRRKYINGGTLSRREINLLFRHIHNLQR